MDTQLITTVELSLVIPAYNEAGIIERNVDELQAWIAKHLPNLSYEILIVDDGSTDGMGTLLDRRASEGALLRVVHHKSNMGRGRAIRTGFEQSRGQYVVCLDADLSYSPDHIPKLIDPLKRGTADITLASAYHPNGRVTNVPFSRAILSRWGNRVLSAGLHGKFHTVTCIVRGYTREAIDQFELINDGKDLHLEILQKATLLGLRVVEIPAHLRWRDRLRGAKKKSRLVDYVPFLSMTPTIASHLVYNYVLRPGSILRVPVLGLMLIALAGFLVLLWSWAGRIVRTGHIYESLRETLIQGALTFFVMSAAAIISMIFLAFYFASQQNKRSFEELYIMLSRMNARLKQIEKDAER